MFATLQEPFEVASSILVSKHRVCLEPVHANNYQRTIAKYLRDRLHELLEKTSHPSAQS
jgi:hypothetical protein